MSAQELVETLDPRTAALRDALDRDGYMVYRDVVSKDRLANLSEQIAAAYDAACQEGRLFEGGGTISGHLNCFPGVDSRFVWDEIRRFGIVDMVGTLRPDIADDVRVTLNYNLPGSVAQHYHMDGLYTEDFLICNIAVVDTDLVNGALDVLPGTNQRFYKFWQYATTRAYRRTTRVPMRQGDIVVRRSTLWHRGMPNRSAVPRPMMAITFGELSAPAHDPFTVFDEQITFFPNWYKTSRAGRLREQVFVKAPRSYSAYRFVKSLHGDHGYAAY